MFDVASSLARKKRIKKIELKKQKTTIANTLFLYSN